MGNGGGGGLGRAITGVHAPKAKRCSIPPLASPCPPPNHTITLNLTLTCHVD